MYWNCQIDLDFIISYKWNELSEYEHICEKRNLHSRNSKQICHWECASVHIAGNTFLFFVFLIITSLFKFYDDGVDRYLYFLLRMYVLWSKWVSTREFVNSVFVIKFTTPKKFVILSLGVFLVHICCQTTNSI